MKSNGMDLYVEKAMRSASRAAVKVLTECLLHNRPLPVWEDGKVKYRLPTKEQIDQIRDKAIKGVER